MGMSLTINICHEYVRTFASESQSSALHIEMLIYNEFEDFMANNIETETFLCVEQLNNTI